MPSPAVIVRDLPGSPDDPFEVAPPEFEFPFLKNGDSVSFIITRSYKQTIAGYNADRLAAKYMPGVAVDSDYPAAILLSEGKPTRTAAAMCAFRRVFATLPPDQTTYGTIPLNKPSPWTALPVSTYLFSWQRYLPTLDNTNVDPSYPAPTAYQIDYNGQFSGTAFAPNGKVYTYRPCAAPTLVAASGGTFTLTYNGSTTGALNWNDSDATIAAAVNALASVVAEGLTFTASNSFASAGVCTLGLTATVGTPANRFTFTGSLTPASCNTLFVAKTSATVFSLQIAARIAFTAHGLDTAKPLYLQRNNASPPVTSATEYSVGFWSAPDANTIAFPGAASSYTYINYVGQPLRNYTPGVARVRVRRVQSFATDPADLALVTPQTSELAILGLAAATGTGYQVLDATELVPWLESPIYTQTVTEINVDNL
jgi:hypothetical protein